MANVKGGPEFRIYINWKTGYLAELPEYPRSKEQAAEGLEQVFLCWHEGSDCLFIDPAMAVKEPRHGEVEHLTLIEFCTMMNEIEGVHMPYRYEGGRWISHWEGKNHSAMLNSTLAPKDGLKYRMRRLDAALLKLTETIEEIVNVKQS